MTTYESGGAKEFLMVDWILGQKDDKDVRQTERFSLFVVTEHRRALQFPLSSLLAPASGLLPPFFFFIIQPSHSALHFLCIHSTSSHLCHSGSPLFYSLLCARTHTHTLTQHFLLTHSLPHVLLSSSSPASPAGRLTAVCIHSCTCVTHWSATGRWAWGGGGHLRIVFPLSYCNLCYKARGVA